MKTSAKVIIMFYFSIKTEVYLKYINVKTPFSCTIY